MVADRNWRPHAAPIADSRLPDETGKYSLNPALGHIPVVLSLALSQLQLIIVHVDNDFALRVLRRYRSLAAYLLCSMRAGTSWKALQRASS